MAKPITIPNTFAAATSAIPLSQLDQDFSTLANATNDLATYSNYVADTGAANAYIANYPANTNTGSLTTGLRLQFKAANANTGASTLNVQVNGGSIGTASIRLTDGSALPANTIIAGAIVDVMYDGTNFQLMNDPSGGQEVITNLTLSGNLTVGGNTTFTGVATGNVVNATTSTITNLSSGNVTITSGTISNVTLDNTTVTQANVTTANVATLQTANLQATGGTANIASLEAVNVTVTGNLFAVNVPSISAVSWDSSADDYFFVAGYPSGPTNIHQNMRRCILNDAGSVVYYLDGLNSTKTISGGTATLNGSAGQVMVEIPKFWVKKTKVGNLNTWWVADAPLPGYSVHPAFIKNGVEVNYRYYGAYDACYLDATDGLYKSGLNLDDLTASLDLAADKLGSVSGIFPIVGATRAECRTLAANRGAGWRQLDFYLLSAVQLLYLVEYGTFNSQLTLGDGNTATTYAASSSTQSDNGGSVAGKSNALGNRSTDIVSGASSGTRATAYMSYRGIENWFGNEWNWVDGMNIGANSINYSVWVNNNDTQFADNTATNYTNIGTALSTSGTYVTNILDIATAFIPSAGGGSSTTGLCDYYFVATGNRVALFGGHAASGALAGGFYWLLDSDSSASTRLVGARLAF